jgi:polar amino acid transport system permease protein
MTLRKLTLGLSLLAALLAVLMAPLAATALASSKSAVTLPKVTYTYPSAANSATVTIWQGNSVQVYYTEGTSPVVAAKCQLLIGGRVVKLSQVPIVANIGGNQTLQFPIDPSYNVPHGNDAFRVVLVTKSGKSVTYDWQYNYSKSAASNSANAPALINLATVRQWWFYIAKGGIVTVELTVISICIAVVFALFGALGRLSRTMSFKEAWGKYRSWGFIALHTLRMIPYWIATFYTSLFRGTPLLLQIIAIYYAIPAVILWLRAHWSIFNGVPAYPSPFVTGVAALSLNYGAYLTEVFRAGIQAVPKGQTEAAWALGMSGGQTQRRIVLPQAFKIVIPAVGNDFIALIKDTSLVSVITADELLHRAQLVGGRTLNFLSALLVAAAVYWALTIFFSFWQAKLERRMEHDRAQA